MSHLNLPNILSTLETNGYAVIQQFLGDEVVSDLRELALNSHHQQLTHKAQVGLTQSNTNTLRGDHIIWLDNTSQNISITQYISQMEMFKNVLNEAFYLSLCSLESHFAIYPKGTGYAKHLDQFHAQKTRKISSVLYLNKNWSFKDGGCLRIYLTETEHVDIEPIGGQLVLFDSARFFHEVLTSNRERVSIAGWFKTRD